jgi:hypothetical protein
MGDAGSSSHPPGLTRRSSLSDLSPQATQHVKVNGQDYFTTKEPLFEDQSFLLVKVDGTNADALLGRPLPDGTWKVSPARNVGHKEVVLYDQKYEVYPIPTLDSGTYKLTPKSPTGGLKANDVVEAVITSDGRWAIVVPNQNTVPVPPPPTPSSSAPPSTRSTTPSSLRSGTLPSLGSSTPTSTQSTTPASTAASSREGSQSREPSPATTPDDGTNKSFFSKLWQRLKDIF